MFSPHECSIISLKIRETCDRLGKYEHCKKKKKGGKSPACNMAGWTIISSFLVESTVWQNFMKNTIYLQEIHFNTICKAFETEFTIMTKYLGVYDDIFDILISSF